MPAAHHTKDRSGCPARRQRISMACQYCRHRKIRCCGGTPCRNCARSQRECEHVPVPEEVNRATREKKAIAKAAKEALENATTTSVDPVAPSSSNSTTSLLSPQIHHSQYQHLHSHQSHQSHQHQHQQQLHHNHSQGQQTFALSPSSFPSFFQVQQFDSGYSGINLSAPAAAAAAAASASASASSRPLHRRSSSVPGYDAARVASPSISQPFRSPTLLEQGYAASSNPYSFNSQPWGSFPSVLEPPPLSNSTSATGSASANPFTPPDSRAGSTEAEQQAPCWSSPSLHLQHSPMINVASSSSSSSSQAYASASAPSALSPIAYSPYPTPPLYTATHNLGYFPSPLQHCSTSPTLAPELSKDDHGLGIGISAKHELVHTPSYLPEEFMARF